MKEYNVVLKYLRLKKSFSNHGNWLLVGVSGRGGGEGKQYGGVL